MKHWRDARASIQAEEEELLMNGTEAKTPSNLIGALSYLLGFVTGVIFLYLEPYDKDEYVRFHARQSIAFSVAWFAVNVVLGLGAGILRPLAGLFELVQFVVNLGFFGVWLFLMFKAYTGDKYKLPILSEWVENAGF
jgi:uncharacterized membrane protein